MLKGFRTMAATEDEQWADGIEPDPALVAELHNWCAEMELAPSEFAEWL